MAMLHILLAGVVAALAPLPSTHAATVCRFTCYSFVNADGKRTPALTKDGYLGVSTADLEAVACPVDAYVRTRPVSASECAPLLPCLSVPP